MNKTKIFQFWEYFKYINGQESQLNNYLSKISSQLSKLTGTNISGRDLKLRRVKSADTDYYNTFEVVGIDSKIAKLIETIEPNGIRIIIRD